MWNPSRPQDLQLSVSHFVALLRIRPPIRQGRVRRAELHSGGFAFTCDSVRGPGRNVSQNTIAIPCPVFVTSHSNKSQSLFAFIDRLFAPFPRVARATRRDRIPYKNSDRPVKSILIVDQIRKKRSPKKGWSNPMIRRAKSVPSRVSAGEGKEQAATTSVRDEREGRRASFPSPSTSTLGFHSPNRGGVSRA